MRRAFTLLELLIAIGILLALAAIAAPVLSTQLAERAYTSAADELQQQLLLARAHAQRTGRPVQVLYRGDERYLYAMIFDPERQTLARDEAISSSGERDAFAFEDDQRDLMIYESWAQRRLPDGVRLTDRPPLDPEDSLLAIAPLAADTDWPRTDELNEESSRTIRLAIFLSDGSALLRRTVWLRDDDGRQGKLTINQWTGLARFHRGAAAENETPALEEDDEQEPDEEFSEFDQREDVGDESVQPPAAPGSAPDQPAESDDEDEDDDAQTL